MSTPEVQLSLILNIDGCIHIIDSIDYSDIIEDHLKNPNLNFTEDDILNYVLEVRDKM